MPTVLLGLVVWWPPGIGGVVLSWAIQHLLVSKHVLCRPVLIWSLTPIVLVLALVLGRAIISGSLAVPGTLLFQIYSCYMV